MPAAAGSEGKAIRRHGPHAAGNMINGVAAHPQVIHRFSPKLKRQFQDALLWNYVDGSVRDVFLCSGMGGNVRCRKGSPCSTRAKGSMYPWPARLRLRAAKPPEGSAPRTFSSAPRPPPCRIAMRRGVVAPYAADAACLRRSRLCSTLFCNRAPANHALTPRRAEAYHRKPWFSAPQFHRGFFRQHGRALLLRCHSAPPSPM